MNVLLVSLQHSGDLSPGADGVEGHLITALKNEGLNIEVLSRLRIKHLLYHRLKKVYYRILFRKEYLITRNGSVAAAYARQVEKRIKKGNIDLVFSLSNIPVAKLKAVLPVVSYSSASYTSLRNKDSEFAKLCLESRRDGARLEQSALALADAICFKSKAGIDAVIQHYSVQKAKLHVIPSDMPWEKKGKMLYDLFNTLNN